ncbi:DUF3108 domain-containing protein [Dyella tabacisoli]|uniref:DUF3108 domain-containing protein n=1 Tax=Dyella tabacisoli TaxID=2282381 RepID=A0A369UGT8_9GAMM|nr:DUF3108 domain-containing protein [Dyella tabacisoli]RDD79962.1 DUF3108 domain-containing protein [Dyella tabacisoli]
MTILTSPRKLAGLALALSTTAAFAAPSSPTPFTATYQVLQGGEMIGEATLHLASTGDNRWEYSNQSQGTAGLAAAFGLSSNETTRFRWNQGAAETESYDYRMNTGLKKKQRHTKIDWSAHQVSVDEGKGPTVYASVPGLIDRNLAPFALGLALRDGKQTVTLPVAVRSNVENQQFKVAGKDNVQVPAGRFEAVRIERTDSDKSFNAWYVPQKYPVPVKLSQSEGGNLVLQLVSYRQP